jgi:hypothetical protein
MLTGCLGAMQHGLAHRAHYGECGASADGERARPDGLPGVQVAQEFLVRPQENGKTEVVIERHGDRDATRRVLLKRVLAQRRTMIATWRRGCKF